MNVTHESRILEYLRNYASEQHGKAQAGEGMFFWFMQWSTLPSLAAGTGCAAWGRGFQLWLDEEHSGWYRGRICHSEHKSQHSSFSSCTRPAPNTHLLTSWAERRWGAVPRDSATSAPCCPWQSLPLTTQWLDLPLPCAAAPQGFCRRRVWWHTLAWASHWNQSVRPPAARWAAEMVCLGNGWRSLELSCSKTRRQLIWSFPPYPCAKSRQYLYRRLKCLPD